MDTGSGGAGAIGNGFLHSRSGFGLHRLGVGFRQRRRADLGCVTPQKNYDSQTVHLRPPPCFSEGICVPPRPLPIWGVRGQVITVKATFLGFDATQSALRYSRMPTPVCGYVPPVRKCKKRIRKNQERPFANASAAYPIRDAPPHRQCQDAS
jgi:hypothetical protein